MNLLSCLMHNLIPYASSSLETYLSPFGVFCSCLPFPFSSSVNPAAPFNLLPPGNVSTAFSVLSRVTHEMELWIPNISLLLPLTFLPYFHWLCRPRFLWTLLSLAHYNAGLYLTYFHVTRAHTRAQIGEMHTQKNSEFLRLLLIWERNINMHATAVPYNTLKWLLPAKIAADTGKFSLMLPCRCCRRYQSFCKKSSLFLHQLFLPLVLWVKALDPGSQKKPHLQTLLFLSLYLISSSECPANILTYFSVCFPLFTLRWTASQG